MRKKTDDKDITISDPVCDVDFHFHRRILCISIADHH